MTHLHHVDNNRHILSVFHYLLVHVSHNHLVPAS